MRDADFRKERKLPAIDDVICGTAVIMERFCGKPGCRCLRGHKHKSVYISWYYKGRGRMAYIPKKNEKNALRLVNNYRILKAAMHKASEANMLRFAAGRKAIYDAKRA